MVEQELANELSQRAAEALTHLVRIIDDQTAKARDRLRAAQILKTVVTQSAKQVKLKSEAVSRPSFRLYANGTFFGRIRAYFQSSTVPQSKGFPNPPSL
jgi:hypothetical protein